MAELIIFSGKLKGQRLILPDREVVVGRDEDCQMRIASSLISRKHCSIKGAPEGVWVRDLESQNGTYVNDVAITEPYLMKPGDILRVGAALFQVPRGKSAARKEGERISDDKISNWLTEDEQTQSSAVPDTTVIKGRQSIAAAPAVTGGPSTGASAQSPETRTIPPKTVSIAAVPTIAVPTNAVPTGTVPANAVPTIRQPLKTVKEQAAEIIRRHWEIVRAQPLE